MCGLFGLTDFGQGKLAAARAALNTLEHRGPDDWGDWHDGRVYLGHRRLSIIDLSDRGRQPMLTDGDQPVALTANGEIYNFRQLRDDLCADWQFLSDSDSEVLLHGFVRWGIEGLLQRIEGMFAFAIYDSDAGKVYLCRDRVGIKPLFYGVFDTQVVWASELKAIVNYKGSSGLAVDASAIYDFVNYRYVPAPKTIYKSIRKLEPATYLEIDVRTGRTRTQRYWSLESGMDIAVSNPESAVKEAIGNAVALQLVSDAPLGVFLSGGVDSSIVACEARRVTNDLKTFAVYFGDDEKEDRYYSSLVADALQTSHHLEQVAPSRVLEHISLLRTHLDEPFADFSFFPTLTISEVAARHVKVALSGDGGDEVFGGYTWYWNDRVTRRRRRQFQRAAELAGGMRTGGLRILKSARYRLHNLLLDQLGLYARLLGAPDEMTKRQYRRRLGVPDDYDDLWHFRRYFRADLPVVTRFQYMDFHTFLPDDVLTKVDRASMAVSLEVRVPLLDRTVIETAFSLPESAKFHPHGGKSLLRKAFSESLPLEIFQRPKVGFGLPRTAWSRGREKRIPSAQELVLRKAFPELGVFD